MRLSPFATRPMRRFACAAVAALLLTACGGGGGGGGGGTQTPPTNQNPPPTNSSPVASFALNPGAGGSAPLVVTVDAAAANDPDGTITGYEWDFGDGTAVQVGEVTQHVYTAAGAFTIQLTVTDNEGATAVAARTLNVSDTSVTVSVSGTINILPSSAVDSDVNDRFSGTTSNNTFDNAQPITNPVTLGGFANLPGTGASTGNLFASGDVNDFYQVELSGGEQILLTIAEPDADLDLTLWDENRAMVDSSVGVTTTESISVPQAGIYFIEVNAFAGASNYVLNVGSTGTQSADGTVHRLSDAFVPGELILTDPSTHQPTISLARLDALAPVAGGGRDARANALRAAREAALEARQLPANARLNAEQRLRMATLLTAKQAARSIGLAAEPNAIRRPLLTPNDPFYTRQWHYESANLPRAWDLTTGSSDVIVAVIDTGVLLNHPDLNDRLVPGFDFISNAARANDGDGIDANPDDPGDLQFGGSSSFHGTHVAGTIGAETDNGTGVAGVDWNARIMPLRALGVDGGTTFDVIQAMRFAAGLSNDSNTVPSERADIINLSLGSEFSSSAEQNTVNQIRDLGILIVASSGNEATDLPSFPAAYDGVVSVAATTISNTRAPYSNFGGTVDIAAPGGNNGTDINGDGIGDGVISTIGDDGSPGATVFGYAALNGTSMAAPHVAGVMALMKAVYPALTPAEFDAALAAGELTVDLGEDGRDDSFGWGLVDARKAVLAAIDLANGQGVDPGPILAATPSTLNFGTFGTELTFTLTNVGTGTLTVTGVSADEPWLTVQATDSNADGTGSYRVIVDRTGLADGNYSATVTATSPAGDATLGVALQVQSANTAADAGLHFVILVDNDGMSNLPAAVVQAQNGEYRFTILNVPPGQYRVFAGTDSDDDNFLCDDGEACGSFRTLDDPETLVVNDDVTAVDFVSEYRLSLQSLSGAQRVGASASSGGGIAFKKPPLPETDTTSTGETQ